MEERFLVGSFNKDDAERGLVLCSLDLEMGAISRIGAFDAGRSPSFLAPLDRERVLVVTMNGDFGEETGELSLVSLDAETGAARVHSRVESGGTGPCHVAADPGGRFCGVANYAGGSSAFFEIVDGYELVSRGRFQHAGSSIHPKRQQKPHAHGVTFSPNSDYAFVCDLGTDEIVRYSIERRGGTVNVVKTAAFGLPGGSGPRHLLLHTDLGVAYTINELSSTVSVLEYDAEAGTLELRNEVTLLPAGFSDHNTAAELALSLDGRTLYASNRGHDSIAVFSVSPSTGDLVAQGHAPSGGEKPWDFSVDPSGRYLVCANHGSNRVSVLQTAERPAEMRVTDGAVEMVRPSCVAFLP